MRSRLSLKQTVVLCGLGGLIVLGFTSKDAQAQSLYCPTSVVATGGTQTGFALSGGNCTNGVIGAFSNAALAAQALSDVSQSASLQSTQVAVEAISARRRLEVERCPDGLVRVNDVCQPPPGAAPAVTTPAPPPRKTARHRAPKAAPAPVYKAPVTKIEPGPRFAVWANGYGDYERRTGTGSTSINCCSNAPSAPAGGIPNALALNSTSHAHSWGVVAGGDVTVRNVWGADDGLIAGLLTGYISSHVQLSTTSTSSTPDQVGNGAATLNANLRGPTVGAYLTYFNGGFSADLTFKVDFLSTDVDFTDSLAYSINFDPIFGQVHAQPTSFSGSGSTNLDNYTTVGNLNYRFPLAGALWMEPTAGFQYTAAVYSSGAAALGLADGHIFRIQGGSRFGIDYYSGTTRITPVLTALAYDDVNVSGGFVSGGVFSTVPVVLADEGKLRGVGILALKIDNGHGFSAFIQGDVYGGEDLIGYGGKAGIRFELGS
jgi:hypothetical protein